MILKVLVPSWELEEDGRVLTPGDMISSWLTFREAEPPSTPNAVQAIQGKASVLPSWPGAEFGRHPVQINIGGGALYWDAAEPVEGDVQVVGTVCTNNVDAPEHFPQTRCVVQRVQMEWGDFSAQGEGVWARTGVTRYEEVSVSYLPREWNDAGVLGGQTMSRWTGVLLDVAIRG